MGKSLHFTYLFLSLLITNLSWAGYVNSKVTFEGTLTDINSNPVDLRTKTISFYVYGSQSNCIYYAESSTTSGYQDGSIIHKIGSGSTFIGSYDASVFTTSTTGYSAPSVAGCVVTPGESRTLKVSVPDFSLTTSIEITSVPSALNTELFAGKALSSFILATTGTSAEQNIINTLTSSGTVGQYLKKSGSGSVSWENLSGLSAGTVTNVSSSNNYITVSNSTTTPVIQAIVGTTTGTLAAGDDSRFSTALQKNNNLSDLTSSSTARTNLGLGNSGVTAGTYGSANTVPSITVDVLGRITGVTTQAYQNASNVEKGIIQVGSNLTVNNGELSLSSANISSALGFTPVSASALLQWSSTDSNLYYTSGTVTIGQSPNPDYALSISGSTIAFQKIAIGGDQVIYKPDQASYVGSLFIGDGGKSLNSSSSGGRYNTGFGLGSLNSVTTGKNNTAIGTSSLAYVVSGTNNTSIGAFALFNNNNLDNTAIGYKSLISSSGDTNTGIGSKSGFNLTTGSANTLIGSSAGENLSSGSNNTFIGKGSGSAITTGSYNTFIGSYNGSDTPTMSNYVVISDGGNNRRITIDNTGRTGIGTASPKATLDVEGFARLKKYTAEPVTCDTDTDGAIALNSQYTLCICKGSSGWVKSSDGSSACVW
ncbi:MAG: beta strand repeat-containing protein [Pseudobdellovibrio sp.]